MGKRMLLLFPLLMICILSGCQVRQNVPDSQGLESRETGERVKDMELSDMIPEEKITELEDGLSSVRYEGDYGFDEFLSRGGASTDGEVIRFLAENLLGNLDMGFAGDIFGCSTITAQDADGKFLFGRNFD